MLAGTSGDTDSSSGSGSRKDPRSTPNIFSLGLSVFTPNALIVLGGRVGDTSVLG